MLDPLLLNIHKSSPDKRFKHLIEGICGGIVSAVYLSLLVWQGKVFLLNSLPFILFTATLYVLRDRVNVVLRTLFYKQAFKWFYDYTSVISPGKNNKFWGIMQETFSFIPQKRLPEEIVEQRNRDSYKILESIKHPEQVIYLKKNLIISKTHLSSESRRSSLNSIFRYNIQRYLAMASEPYEYYSYIDPESSELKQAKLPKVYHLNIVLKNTYMNKNKIIHVEFKRYRIVIDKTGIKRIESVTK